MEIMTYNIQLSRSKYGSDKIVFESGKYIFFWFIETSNVSCVFCPYKNAEKIEWYNII